MLNHQDELAVHQHGDVIVVTLIQDLFQVHTLKLCVRHLQICAVEGVVEGEEMLLPVPVLGEVVHEEGVFVLSVFVDGFFVLHPCSFLIGSHIYYCVNLTKKCVFVGKRFEKSHGFAGGGSHQFNHFHTELTTGQICSAAAGNCVAKNAAYF